MMPCPVSKQTAQIFRLLEISHRASIEHIPTTKRDAFYQDVELFGSQKVVDTLVDDLAATFDVERSELHIRSSSKGLVCGSSLRIKLLSGEEIECKDSESTLIPAGEDTETFSVDERLSWVLVVEKEAVFQTLVRLGVTKSDMMPGDGIIITGKGYPDVSTRHLVKSLADALPKRIPVCGIFDGDPYGIDILSVYKFGSRAMRHENDRLAAKRIRWLGVCPSELPKFGINREMLLPISPRDHNKILSLLKRSEVPLPKKWKKELQHMLFSRRKAEIEILCSKRTNNTQPCEDSQGLEALASSQSSQTTSADGKKETAGFSDSYTPLVQYVSGRLTYFIDKARSSEEDKTMESQLPLEETEASIDEALADEHCDDHGSIWDVENDFTIETDMNNNVDWDDMDMLE